MDITVATFNLRTHRGRDGENAWEQRVDAVAATFTRLGATLVGTQEGHPEMLADLAARLPDFRWVGQSRFGEQPDEYCALFYRPAEVEIDAVGHFWLSETPDVPASQSWESSLPRMCTWARCRFGASGPALTVYNTHLDHVSERARLEGVRVIARALEARRRDDHLPALLMGDLNAGWGSAPLRFLREDLGLRDAFAASGPEAVGRTFHGFAGGSAGDPIDYIFGTPDLALRGAQVFREQIGGRYPSDHYPLVARVHWT